MSSRGRNTKIAYFSNETMPGRARSGQNPGRKCYKNHKGGRQKWLIVANVDGHVKTNMKIVLIIAEKLIVNIIMNREERISIKV